MAKISITQVRSAIGRQEVQKKTLTALGINKMGRPVVHDDTPQIRGMVKKIEHLLSVEEMNE
ncbi:50S ribosomal protein L30 [bacterium]|nr:50S ribosomal protein L30 [bacterium]